MPTWQVCTNISVMENFRATDMQVSPEKELFGSEEHFEWKVTKAMFSCKEYLHIFFFWTTISRTQKEKDWDTSKDLEFFDTSTSSWLSCDQDRLDSTNRRTHLWQFIWVHWMKQPAKKLFLYFILNLLWVINEHV